MKLIIKWSVKGQAINDFHCEELSKWIAEEVKVENPPYWSTYKLNLRITFIDNTAIIEIANEVLVNNLRALVKEGEIKEAELWFVDEPDEFGPKETNMKLDKNGKCAIWPHKLGYNMNVLMRLI